MDYAISRPSDQEWVRTRTLAEYGRAIVDLTSQLGLQRSRARLWRYPPGASGRPHIEREQEEVFVVLEGTLTLVLGNPACREVLPVGTVAAVRPGTPIHVRNRRRWRSHLSRVWSAPGRRRCRRAASARPEKLRRLAPAAGELVQIPVGRAEVNPLPATVAVDVANDGDTSSLEFSPSRVNVIDLE